MAGAHYTEPIRRWQKAMGGGLSIALFSIPAEKSKGNRRFFDSAALRSEGQTRKSALDGASFVE
jgi:hypothetical protein